jgi:hypothetical protein
LHLTCHRRLALIVSDALGVKRRPRCHCSASHLVEGSINLQQSEVMRYQQRAAQRDRHQYSSRSCNRSPCTFRAITKRMRQLTWPHACLRNRWDRQFTASRTAPAGNGKTYTLTL